MNSKSFAFGNLRDRALTRLACAFLALGGGASALAETAPVDAAPGANSYSVSLKQLGRNYPMSLRGVESTDSVSFDVRADSIVTGAKLNLQYTYSPALLADLSQINVIVNDEVAASLALPKENAGQLQQQLVEIPAQLITEFNRLSLQFVGHYTMGCEDPQHSSLWAKISNATELSIQVSPLALPNDLSIMPLPFFDRRDARTLSRSCSPARRTTPPWKPLARCRRGSVPRPVIAVRPSLRASTRFRPAATPWCCSVARPRCNWAD
jgi:hypothetical protein